MLPSRSNDRDHINKQGARVVSFAHEQNSIYSQKQLNDIAHEHTIICRSHGGFSANEKEETLASNDNYNHYNSLRQTLINKWQSMNSKTILFFLFTHKPNLRCTKFLCSFTIM